MHIMWKVRQTLVRYRLRPYIYKLVYEHYIEKFIGFVTFICSIMLATESELRKLLALS